MQYFIAKTVTKTYEEALAAATEASVSRVETLRQALAEESRRLAELADSSGGAGPRRFRVVDKHGLSRYVYNLQLDIGLEGHNLCLGLDDSSLDQAAGAADGHSPDSAPSAAQVIDDLASMLKKRSARMTED